MLKNNIEAGNNRKAYFKKASGCNFARRFFILCLLFILILLSPKRTYGDTTFVGGRISSDTTWTLAGNPYVVTSAIEVYGDATTPARLTIDTGVVVRFSSGMGLKVGSGESKGILRAVGGSIEPEKIKFTANTETPGRGMWSNIYFDDGAVDYDTVSGTGSVLENCVVEYGSQPGYADENIYILNSSPKINKCGIKESGANGIRVNGGSPSIENCILSNNGTNAILLQSAGCNSLINGNTIIN
ncbi:MAG: right-handed parallel beta-helix repeat-containing protein, partial [bacterium]